MIQNKMVSLGFLLFSLSFLFLFTGLYLDFSEKHSFNDPIKDVVIIKENSDDIIISTTGNDSDKTVESPSNENSNSNSIPNNSDEKNSQEIIDLNNKVQLLKTENDTFRKTIENTYGIKVKYGSDTNSYKAGSMSTIALEEPTVIKSALKQLNAALTLYPKDFFKEFKDVDLSLEIYLIQRYSSDNVTGVTDLSGNRVIISVALDYPFSESIHHEIYHYIEHFIERKHGKFSNWNAYNPKGFHYGSANNNLSFNRTNNPSAPFVNNYAQTNADEDRASLFEYMTADLKPPCFTSVEYPIWKKSSYVALMIDTYFETVNPSIVDYWERFIY